MKRTLAEHFKTLGSESVSKSEHPIEQLHKDYILYQRDRRVSEVIHAIPKMSTVSGITTPLLISAAGKHIMPFYSLTKLDGEMFVFVHKGQGDITGEKIMKVTPPDEIPNYSQNDYDEALRQVLDRGQQPYARGDEVVNVHFPPLVPVQIELYTVKTGHESHGPDGQAWLTVRTEQVSRAPTAMEQYECLYELDAMFVDAGFYTKKT